MVGLVAIISGIILYSCQKDTARLKSTIPKIESLTFEDIDRISSEIADFHTFAMKKFLVEVYSEKDILDNNSVAKIVNFIEKEMRGYDYKYIQLDKDNLDFSEILSLENIETMISFSKNNYDFSKLQLKLSNTQSSELEKYLATLNTNVIQMKCNNIDSKVPAIIKESEDFEEFKLKYLNFVEKQLADVKTKDEYLYIRFFADVYLSSVEYVTEFLFNDNAKGKFWEMVKEGWNIAKPIVAADAEGAVGGAMVGMVTGPGIVACGMGGACSNSMIKVIGG
jgi:hypothetical protein